jgi:hypothetical protein
VGKTKSLRHDWQSLKETPNVEEWMNLAEENIGGNAVSEQCTQRRGIIP